MTLIITVVAAIISTIIWYTGNEKRRQKTGFLCLMYWGASLMWLIDEIFVFSEVGMEVFHPEKSEMWDDIYLGFSVVGLGLALQLIILIVQFVIDRTAGKRSHDD